MNYSKMTCEEFVEALSTGAPVPGGGGAAALAGAAGIALGNMVGSLTVGKKKYADVEAEVALLMSEAARLQNQIMFYMQKDAEAFAPLSKAYGLPRETEEQREYRDVVMEAALIEASEVPLELMAKCCEAIRLHEQFARKGASIAISDVGVGVLLCRAALLGASLNVFINTKLMKDRERAESMNTRAERMISEFVPLADSIFNDVRARL